MHNNSNNRNARWSWCIFLCCICKYVYFFRCCLSIMVMHEFHFHHTHIVRSATYCEKRKNRSGMRIRRRQQQRQQGALILAHTKIDWKISERWEKNEVVWTAPKQMKIASDSDSFSRMWFIKHLLSPERKKKKKKEKNASERRGMKKKKCRKEMKNMPGNGNVYIYAQAQ